MRGRKPKPTQVKALTGNPGKRPLNLDEPRPTAAIPDCPPELSPASQRAWTRLVGELGQLRMLTNLDRAALAAYCGAYALWAEATEALVEVWSVGEISERIPNPVAVSLDRQSPGGNYDADRFRVRVHAGKSRKDRRSTARRTYAFRFTGS